MTRTPLSRSKGQRSTCRGGGILWRLPLQLVLFVLAYNLLSPLHLNCIFQFNLSWNHGSLFVLVPLNTNQRTFRSIMCVHVDSIPARSLMFSNFHCSNCGLFGNLRLQPTMLKIQWRDFIVFMKTATQKFYLKIFANLYQYILGECMWICLSVIGKLGSLTVYPCMIHILNQHDPGSA